MLNMFMLPTSKAIMTVHLHAYFDYGDVENTKFDFFIQGNYTSDNTNNA